MKAYRNMTPGACTMRRDETKRTQHARYALVQRCVAVVIGQVIISAEIAQHLAIKGASEE